jgi:NAD(P)-dependent dehydrogenase (short-subunit alcohol dehydrogenase family)
VLAYGQSKTANILFAVEATRRWADDGITANAVHPGSIIETNLARHLNQETFARITAQPGFTYKTVEQGAATSVLLATSPQLKGIGGHYFEDCEEAVLLDSTTQDVSGIAHGVADYALDPAAAERLWHVSLELLA